MTDTEPSQQVTRWLATFAERLAAADHAGTLALFEPHCYWRDLVALTWSLVTLEGKPEVERMLERCLPASVPASFSLEGEPRTDAAGVTEAWFRFETRVAVCRGHLRLRDGLCWTLFTCMLELKGFEEKRGALRAKGVQHGAVSGRKTWSDDRREAAATLGSEVQPYCLIIGGGQGGVTLAARLKMLNVPALVVDRHPSPGDAWRERYKSLCLHDPVWNIHLPYLPFPDHWPVFTPKDKMADWIEAYVSIMELDYWSASAATAARYDDERGEWTVTVERQGETVILKPKHLVVATGMSGPPAVPHYRGQEAFAGLAHHSSAYRSGEAFKGKRCVVIGSNNSAHDICADLWEHGADVTMVQRSSTTVVRAETLRSFLSSKLYSEEALAAGITTDKADFTYASRPYAVMAEAQKAVYIDIRKHDSGFYDALERAGFLLDFGEDDTGLSMKYLRRGSGYYIDVGASELIIDGRVKLKSGVQVERLARDGLTLSDGSFLAADLIVYATGFDPMERWLEQLISPAVAAKVGHVWGLGSDTRRDPGPWLGELRNMWKPTRQDALWMHGGNLHQARFYSKLLALQLKARLEGLETPVHDPRGLGSSYQEH
ncbi:flavin-containing monooxygenase [Phreatobacter stygius]|uniref:NAD(P)/FAD-dependent oxidoreductase n=1 Tax=Phreatobacter stygius TaxID=1940610 RepID=A0A4D7B3G6_9HYPH|nr:NAD(P)/FAD-dependent oxidoreductase [Phreatobacter stygius]QCI68309.1 NAD(P)/FAD-dependent oxidoreductase [Phreatobacter stygius]